MSEAAPGEDPLPPLRDVIRRHGLAPTKALGQNFLLDLNITRRIARTAAPLGRIVEVGPGPGGLTRALLLEGAERVIALERDSRCEPALREIGEAFPDRLQIIMGDALTADFESLSDGPVQIVANLPYNVGTELLVRWLRGDGHGDTPPFWSGMSLMFQKEVAERIVAQPGSKAYGRLSVLAQSRADARILFDLPPQAFTPPPKVTSAVVRLSPLPALRHSCRLQALERVAAAAFGQRRKMLRQSLKSLGAPAAELCAAAGVSPEARAETIDLEGFAALARAWDAWRTS